MSYHEQSFGARFHTLGDEAESQFIQWAHDQGLKWEEFGWRRPSTGMGKMSVELRHLPDFYASDGYLYEVMGMGRDGILKGVKEDKWEALKMWNSIQPVRLFVWNSSEKRGVVVGWQRAVLLVARARRRGLGQFHDGPRYYPIPWEDLE